MTQAELLARFPNAGPSFLKRNATDFRSAGAQDSGQTHLPDNSAGPLAKLERDPGHGTLGQIPVQKGVGRQFLIRVTSIRKRLLDTDNLCEKYAVDLCRYAGIVPGDSPATTRIEVSQQKAEPGAAEEVKIEVYEIG